MRVIVALIIVLASLQCQAQPTYLTELLEASGKLSAIKSRIDRLKKEDVDERMDIKVNLGLLQRGLFRLSEEAQNAKLAFVQAAQPVDRNISIASSAITSLILTKELLWSFLETGDRIFVTQAVASASIARTLQQAMR